MSTMEINRKHLAWKAEAGQIWPQSDLLLSGHLGLVCSSPEFLAARMDGSVARGWCRAVHVCDSVQFVTCIHTLGIF